VLEAKGFTVSYKENMVVDEIHRHAPDEPERSYVYTEYTAA